VGVERSDRRTDADPSNADAVTDADAPPHADAPTDANPRADSDADGPADPDTDSGADARPDRSADPSSAQAGCRGRHSDGWHVTGHRSGGGGGLRSGGSYRAHARARERRGHGWAV
jgi:hypothetical protein